MEIEQAGSGRAAAPAYPRRRVLRVILRMLAGMAFAMLGKLRIEGRENLPQSGPYIVVSNHFHFSDPVALLWASRRQVEFIGGFRFLMVPRILHFIPHLWGYFPAFRGGYSRQTLRSAMIVLQQHGIVGLFPEGGIWAQVLRPPRAGTAFLALEAGVPVVPVGLDGFTLLFKHWRPVLTIKIGQPVGPFVRGKPGKGRRAETDLVGDAIMLAVANLIPPERRGVYSPDPRLRQEAESVSAFPFDKEEYRGM